MASRITLPFWPTSLDNLKWSSDNLIAVAGGDQIGILTPRLSGEPGPNGTFWNSTYFKANAFTAQEAPLLKPLTFTNFSPGEELSQRHVDVLEWSPPGLSRFRGCVLGVLSTNHVLSLWECDGRGDVSANWERKVVINHSLIEHYSILSRATAETEQLFRERKQVAQRVRCFAWSTRSSSENGRQSLDNSSCLMAVSTEAGDIVILNIRSPYQIIHPEKSQWEVEVLRSFKVNDLVAEADAGVVNGAAHRSSQSLIADHIALGPWQVGEATTTPAALSFIAEGKLYSFQVEMNQASPTAQTQLWRQTQVQHLLPSTLDLTGPMRYTPNTGFLTLFAADTVHCIDTATPSEGNTGSTSHHLDGRWDEVSGLAFTRDSAGTQKIHIVSHMSSSKVATTSLILPLGHVERSPRTRWQEAIVQLKTAFSNQHDLDGHVQDRTWGIASSPLGDCVVTAITLLPSDSIAHVIPSERQTIITITQEEPSNDDSTLLGDGSEDEVYSEVKLFHLQRLFEQKSGITELDDLGNIVSQGLGGEDLGCGANPDPPSDLTDREIVAILRSRVLEELDMRFERNMSLASIALGSQTRRPQRSPAIIRRLVSEVVKLMPIFTKRRDLTVRICNIYGVLALKISIALHPLEPHLEEGVSPEVCRICEDEIPFANNRWARCASGHQFSRCALTFLTIQEPGFSKHCGVCGVQVLNEWKIPELTSMGEEPADTEQRERPLHRGMIVHDKDDPREQSASLARILFAALDRCIYCGGSFVG